MSSSGAAFSPSPGSTATTSSASAPAGGSATGTAVTLVKPASGSSSTTSSTSSPTRSLGIVSVAGPTLISAVTVLPGATSVPRSGSCLVTVPTLSSSGPSTLRKAGCRPTSRSSCSAACRLLPSTEGTVTLFEGPPASTQYAPKARPASTSRVSSATSTVRPAGARRCVSVGWSASATMAVLTDAGRSAAVAPPAAGTTGPCRPWVASSSTSVTGDGTGAPARHGCPGCGRTAGRHSPAGRRGRGRCRPPSPRRTGTGRPGPWPALGRSPRRCRRSASGISRLGGVGVSRTCW